MKIIVLTLWMGIVILSAHGQVKITPEEISGHLEFLTSKKHKGRYPGGRKNKKLVRYIANDFQASGIAAFEKKYLQAFEATLRVKEGEKPKRPVKTWNVIGLIEGRDPKLKHEYIVLGAHYDHLGWGGPTSKKPGAKEIHPGADDNASGTTALLEIGEKLSHNRYMLSRSVILVAFGAEEQGLLGSKYFAENPPVPLSSIKLMINMDMVGRLNAEQQVYMGGAGTFPDGIGLMMGLGVNLGLNPIVHAGEVGGSDHVSFYKKNISVLGIHTGGHDEYHRPDDVIEKINVPGLKTVSEYIYQTILKVADRNYTLEFVPQD